MVTIENTSRIYHCKENINLANRVRFSHMYALECHNDSVTFGVLFLVNSDLAINHGLNTVAELREQKVP